MQKKNVALLYGGAGGEHEVSLSGAKLVLSKIDRTKYDVLPVLIDKKGRLSSSGKALRLVYTRRGATLLGDGIRFSPDVAFPLLHGDFGEDGRVQGMLDFFGIPYVGCGVTAGAVCADKILTKAVARSLSVPCVPDVSVTRDYGADEVYRAVRDTLAFPVFIKPSGLGSSLGASVARDRESFLSAYNTALDVGGERILIEKFIEDRREIEVGYLSSDGEDIFTHPGEVIVDDVYTYLEKYGSESRAKTEVRADIPEEMTEKIIAYARRLVLSLGISSLARIDFFLSGKDIYFNEINTMPGFTEASLYPGMISALGISVSELITRLIEDATLKAESRH